MSKKEDASNIFNNGFNCCQSVLGSFCEDLGLDKENAFRIAAGLGGGCRRGEVCGAVSGGLMALGLKYGFADPGDEEKKNKAYSKVQEFLDRFEDRYGAITCRKILGYDISKEEEYRIIKEKDLFQSVCVKVVQDAAGILEDMMDD